MIKTTELSMTKNGGAQSVRLPADLIRRYGFAKTLRAELREDGLLLKSGEVEKLSWEETAKQMAASEENWSAWDGATEDGLDACPWDHPVPANVQAWARKSAQREGRARKQVSKRS